MTISSTLTSWGRSSLVQSIISGTNYTTPQYLQQGTGNSTALATDQTVSSPYGSRATCTVSAATVSTSGDTFRLNTTITYSSAQTITNIGIFDASTLAPQTVLQSQLDPGVTTVTVTGYSNFPSYPFDAQLGSEVITVTTGNGSNSWTVVRNTNGSPISTSGFPAGTVIVGGNQTSNGNMFLKSSFSGIPLNAGDQIQFTIDVQFA